MVIMKMISDSRGQSASLEGLSSSQETLRQVRKRKIYFCVHKRATEENQGTPDTIVGPPVEIPTRYTSRNALPMMPTKIPLITF